MPDAGLLGALRALVPPEAGLGWADPGAEHALLPPESLRGAVPARLREFAAGRAAARRALAELGLPPLPIPRGADRAPIWPVGIVGSITHTRVHCLAVVLPSDRARGIGLDLEPDTPLDPTLWDTVLRPEERVGMTGAQAKRVFCAKEAAFKAQFAQSGTLYDFDVMRIEWQGEAFRATFASAIPPFAMGDSIRGQICTVTGHILALAHL